MSEQSDVLIVGGSIAGCIAALYYAQKGLRSTIVDKTGGNTTDYKRLCTHFIQPSALPVLRELGLDKAIEDAGGNPNKADIWTGIGWIRSDKPYSADPQLSHGYNIERRNLDPLLRRIAHSDPLITFRNGLHLNGIVGPKEGAGTVAIEFSDHHQRKVEFRGSLVVAADGRFSKMAELLSNSGDVHPNMRFACFAYFENVPLRSGDHSQFWMLGCNMAFAYPLSENRTLICLFITKKDWPHWKDDLENKFLSFVRGLEDAPPVDAGRRVSTIYKMLDMPNILRKPVLDGVAFIGDAAMALDPMSGVGCAFAIQTAAWMAECTYAAIRDGLPLDGSLQQYALCHKQRLLPHATGICADSLAEPISESRQHFFREIGDDPDLTQAFLALTGRIITPKEFQSAWLKKRVNKS